jgi:hypothetical protein
MKTVSIRIVAVPPGEAPDDVRRAWVGLVLPAAPAARLPTVGVVTGPRTFLGQFFALLRGELTQEVGYAVSAAIAVELLTASDPVAAAWWQANTPHLLKPGKCLVFRAGDCQELPPEKL